MEQQTERKDYLEFRKKRVKRIKRFLITALVVLLLIPNVLSIYLLIRVNSMNRILEETQQSLWELSVQFEDANAAVAEQEIQTIEVSAENLKEAIPDAQMYPDKKLVYLTFDDGPSEYTDEILDILSEYNVKATFFVLAKEGYDEQYKRIVEEGHTLALHSYTHQYSSIYASPEAFHKDVTDLSDYLFEITGYRCEFYRFPGGSSNTIIQFDKNSLFQILEEEELVYFDWNVTSKDASSQRLSAATITNNVLSGVEQTNTSVVLMHDASDKYTTVQALPQILDGLLADETIQVLPITQGTSPVCHVVRTENGEE